jgi:hypothetical protein
MENSKNIALLIGGGTAIGLGLMYFTYNKYQGIPDSSTGERQKSVDSDSGIGTLPASRESSVDNQPRTLSNESNSSTSTYGNFFGGGAKNKKTKKLRKTKINKRKKLSRKNNNKNNK